MTGEKILIVDPSREDVGPLMEELLYPEGYVVVHALDGKEGLRQAMDGNPDLIIAEFATPQRSGLEILAQVRQSKQETPFILTGVSGSPETFKRALHMGVIDYLLKPLDLDEARSAIDRALSGRSQPASDMDGGLLTRSFELINRQLEKRLREMSILYGIGKAVASIRDLGKLLNRIVEAAVYLTGAEEGFLLLVDEETNDLYLRAGQGLGKKFATGFRVKSEDSLPLQVLQTGKPIMISSVSDEERFKLKTGYLVKALIHVALNIRGEVIGVLSVDNKVARHSFTENDFHLLSALADYAAVAIDNVQQYERAEAEAAKFAELLSEQTTQPPPSEPLVETVPLDWLLAELQAQQEIANEGLKETEKLDRDLTALATTSKNLAERWRNQQVESEELARRLVGMEAASIEGGTEARAATLTQLQSILNNLTEGLIVTDHLGIVRLANRTATELLSTGRVVSQDLRLVSTDPHWTRSVDRLRSSQTHDKTAWHEAAFWNDGRLIKAVFLSLSEQDGENGEWAVILTDLGRERAVESAREDLNSIISQELRTPMTIITSYTDLLLDEVVGLLMPVQRRVLESMRANLTRTNEILNNLMAVSPTAIEMAKEIPLTVDLNTVVEEALADTESSISEKDLRVDLDMAQDLPMAAAERDCVYQMVSNLLQNAIRATPPGGTIGVHLEVDQGDVLKEQPPHLVVSVSDQGGGIAPKFLSQVFERFYSEEGQPIPGLGGQGTELSLVKTLVETFGGRVWVETEAGVGSTFIFVLPTIRNQ